MGDTKCIRGLQILLAMYGYDVGLSRSNLASWVMKVICVVLMSSIAANATVSVLSEFMKPQYLTMFMAVRVQAHFYNLIFFSYVLFKQNSIVRFVENVSKYLFNIDVSVSKRLTHIALLAMLVPISGMVATGIMFDTFAKTYSDGFNLRNDTLEFKLFVTCHQTLFRLTMSWPTIATATYCCLFYVLIKAQKNLLIDVSDDLTLKRRRLLSNKCLTFPEQFDILLKLNDDFESLMSVIPFLTLSDLFVEFTRIIMLAKHMSLSVLYLSLFFDTVSAIILVYFVHMFKNNLIDVISNVKQSINNCKNVKMSTKTFVLMNLEKMENLKATALNMFNVEPSLLLSFTSALISFTILFVTL